MRSDPTIIVSCDGPGCSVEEEVNLTPLAGGAYDERNVDGYLRRHGWTKRGGSDFCEDCSRGEAPDAG